MGFYSYKCAKTKISIPSVHAGLPKAASRVVVIKPDSSLIIGTYDGYGNVLLDDGTVDEYLRECLKLAEKQFPSESCVKNHYKFFRMVREDVYNNEKFEDLKPNKDCPEQGYFYENKNARKIILSLMKYPLLYKNGGI
jgi:hypothetical protein